MESKLFKSAILAGACTAALSFGACDNSANRTSSATTPVDTAAKSAEAPKTSDNQPVTLTGCLMRGDGRHDYVLTKANEPIGTSGSADETGSIPAKTRAAAARSYRLNGDNDELDKLVGHRVRVSGDLADKGNLSKKDERGTSGTMSKDQEISESDLAKIDVKSIESIADSCDNAKPGKSRR